MLKKMLLCALAVLSVMAACHNPMPRNTEREDRPFADEVVIKTTPVKDQGRSALCWAFAMLSTIESERLMMGDSVELSVDYYGRLLLRDLTREYYFDRSRGEISLRGMPSMLLNMMETYGAEPYTTLYNGRAINYNVLCRKVKQMADTAPTLSALDARMEQLLDDNIGFVPRYVFMLSMEYTPRQFAESVCLPGEYLALTSFTHHPFGRDFVLEVPDNRMRDRFLNIPIDTLMWRVERAIRNGHPVCWEGDISEPGFDYDEGCAVLPEGIRDVTQAQRQHAFETRKTTDDHCMSLCGVARDKHGRTFFLAKNSWGKTNKYGGFMYLSYDYVKLKTIAVYMSRSAWGG